jgi:hypothetical protein
MPHDLTQTTRQTTGQTTRQTTRQNEYEDDLLHQQKLTNLFASKGPRFAKASLTQQREAQQIMNESADELAKQKKAEDWAEQLEIWEESNRGKNEEEEQKLLRRTRRSFVEQMAHSTIKNVPRLFGYDGGSKSKEILGKQRRIYKVAGSRKEHVKYKGELIPVSDYKKLFKK